MCANPRNAGLPAKGGLGRSLADEKRRPAAAAATPHSLESPAAKSPPATCTAAALRRSARSLSYRAPRAPEPSRHKHSVTPILTSSPIRNGENRVGTRPAKTRGELAPAKARPRRCPAPWHRGPRSPSPRTRCDVPGRWSTFLRHSRGVATIHPQRQSWFAANSTRSRRLHSTPSRS